MSVMPDIVEFLTARLGDDEAYAVEAAKEFGPDWIEIWSGEIDLSANLPDRQPPAGRHWDAHVQTNDSRVSRHMVRHDPARVLAEVKAKRALMALHQAEQVEYLDGDGQDRMSTDCTTCDTCGCADTWPCDTLKLLAAPYAEHPDYKQEWSVE